MRRLPCSVLLLLLITAGCARSDDATEPAPSPEVARLLEVAASPEVELDPLDAPAAPRGFSRVDVLRLAGWLVEAVERTSTADTEHVRTLRDAVDHTFEALDMRSRLRIRDLMDSTSREDYGAMPVDWMIVDRWERGHGPAGRPRVIKAAWHAGIDEGHLEVRLQVLQAYVSVAGEPMFVDRTFALISSDPARSPAVPVYFGAFASVPGIDRCHVVRQGRFRPETDDAQLARTAAALERDVASGRMRDSSGGSFRRGCD